MVRVTASNGQPGLLQWTYDIPNIVRAQFVRLYFSNHEFVPSGHVMCDDTPFRGDECPDRSDISDPSQWAFFIDR